MAKTLTHLPLIKRFACRQVQLNQRTTAKDLYPPHDLCVRMSANFQAAASLRCEPGAKGNLNIWPQARHAVQSKSGHPAGGYPCFSGGDNAHSMQNASSGF